MQQLKDLLSNQKVLIPYFTFGDTSISFTETLIKKSFDNGADIIELGIPFSDPIADGPVIQASHQRALTKNHDISLKQALSTVKTIKQTIDKPIIFMADVNLIDQYGVDRFFKESKDSKMSGVVIPNLPVEAAKIYIEAAKKYQIALIFLVSPLCPDDRIKKSVEASTGFLYLIASTGTTGERKSINTRLESIAKKIKKIKDIPIVVGFGISTPEQFKNVLNFADGAIVGSHLVAMIGTQKKEEAIKSITNRLKAFKA